MVVGEGIKDTCKNMYQTCIKVPQEDFDIDAASSMREWRGGEAAKETNEEEEHECSRFISLHHE